MRRSYKNTISAVPEEHCGTVCLRWMGTYRWVRVLLNNEYPHDMQGGAINIPYNEHAAPECLGGERETTELPGWVLCGSFRVC